MIDRKYLESVPPDVELEEAKCAICNSNDHMQHEVDCIDQINFLDGLYGIERCSKCNLYITNPRPSELSIGYYYPDSYGPYQVQHSDKVRKVRTSKLFRLIDRYRKSEQHYLPPMPVGKLLEVGAASGDFMCKMKSRGWDVEGIEYSKSACAKASERGLNVFQGSVFDFPQDNRVYDLVVGWMVIEHLHHPRRALELLRRGLKDNGKLVISIPNMASIEYRTFRENSYSLHIPNHLYHFTPESITELLMLSGFTVTKVHHQATLLALIPSLGRAIKGKVILGKFSKILVSFSQSPLWVAVLLYPLAWLVGQTGNSGRMTVWAEKTK